MDQSDIAKALLGFMILWLALYPFSTFLWKNGFVGKEKEES